MHTKAVHSYITMLPDRKKKFSERISLFSHLLIFLLFLFIIAVVVILLIFFIIEEA